MDIDLNGNKIEDLPSLLMIHTFKNKETGVWVADLVEHDVVTEANTFIELVENINDLVYVLFDIPIELRSKIVYRPVELIKPKDEKNIQLNEQMTFNILISPDLKLSPHNA